MGNDEAKTVGAEATGKMAMKFGVMLEMPPVLTGYTSGVSILSIQGGIA